jgi:hypothetical protein
MLLNVGSVFVLFSRLCPTKSIPASVPLITSSESKRDLLIANQNPLSAEVSNRDHISNTESLEKRIDNLSKLFLEDLNRKQDITNISPVNDEKVESLESKINLSQT